MGEYNRDIGWQVFPLQRLSQMFFISKIFGYRSFIEQINGVDLVYEYRLDKRHNLTPKTQISLFK